LDEARATSRVRPAHGFGDALRDPRPAARFRRGADEKTRVTLRLSVVGQRSVQMWCRCGEAERSAKDEHERGDETEREGGDSRPDVERDAGGNRRSRRNAVGYERDPDRRAADPGNSRREGDQSTALERDQADESATQLVSDAGSRNG